MENNVLQITWCYPDLLNLHGDRGNIMALEKVGKLLDINVTVNKVENLEDTIPFDTSDILFFNVGELRMVQPVIAALQRQEKALKEYIEKGKMILVIGTSGAIFAKEIRRIHETFEGLGILDMNVVEREAVYGDDLIYTLREDPTMKIVGNQIQLVDFYIQSDIALGEIVYGYGNCGFGHPHEGAKYRNVIFTNCLGPVFVKNPWYTERLIKEAMKTKGQEIQTSVAEENYEIERKSMECIEQYVQQKK